MLKRKLQEKREKLGNERPLIEAFIKAHGLHHYKSISNISSELSELTRPSPTQDRSPVVAFIASPEFRTHRLLLGVFMHAHIDTGTVPQKDPLVLSELVAQIGVFSDGLEDGLIPVRPTARHHFQPAAAYFATGRTLFSLPAETRQKLLMKTPGLA